jgi:hypothetical protein
MREIDHAIIVEPDPGGYLPRAIEGNPVRQDGGRSSIQMQCGCGRMGSALAAIREPGRLHRDAV